MLPYRRIRANSGFTLIELLVVISIIALLISILLPALSAARAQAKVTKDLSNLHQQGIAFAAFSTDHDGLMPYRFRDNPNTTWTNQYGTTYTSDYWPKGFGPGYGQVLVYAATEPQDGYGVLCAKNYIANSKIFFSPSMPISAIFAFGKTGTPYFMQKNPSSSKTVWRSCYYFNPHWAVKSNGKYAEVLWKRMSRVPSTRIISCDAVSGYNTANSDSAPQFGMLMGDGSAKVSPHSKQVYIELKHSWGSSLQALDGYLDQLEGMTNQPSWNLTP